VPTVLENHQRTFEGEVMSKIAGDINREMLGYAEKHTGDCYGDGTVYRGERSKDSAVPTYTLQELAYAKGVPSMVTSAMLALGQDCLDAQATIKKLEADVQQWRDIHDAVVKDSDKAHELLRWAETEMRYAEWGTRLSDQRGRTDVYEAIVEFLK
jgi:hypothetical protein